MPPVSPLMRATLPPIRIRHGAEPFATGPGTAVKLGKVAATRVEVSSKIASEVAWMNASMGLASRSEAIRAASFRVAPEDLKRLRADPVEFRAFLAQAMAEAMPKNPSRPVGQAAVLWPESGNGVAVYRPVYDRLQEQLGGHYFEDNPKLHQPDYPNLSPRLHHVLGSMLAGAPATVAYQVQWAAKPAPPREAMLAMLTVNERTGEINVLGRHWPK